MSIVFNCESISVVTIHKLENMKFLETYRNNAKTLFFNFMDNVGSKILVVARMYMQIVKFTMVYFVAFEIRNEQIKTLKPRIAILTIIKGK